MLWRRIQQEKTETLAARKQPLEVGVADQQLALKDAVLQQTGDEQTPGLPLIILDWKSAIATAAELVKKFARNVDVLDLQGRAQTAAGDLDGAISTYQRAREIAPDSLPILYSYINLLKSAKKSRDARTVLQTAIDRILRSRLARIWRALGVGYMLRRPSRSATRTEYQVAAESAQS